MHDLIQDACRKYICYTLINVKKCLGPLKYNVITEEIIPIFINYYMSRNG